MRMLVMWRHPEGPSARDGAQWAHREAVRATAALDARRAALVHLLPVDDHPLEHDWLLEVDFATEESAFAALRAPAVVDLLLDLRMLGMKPAVTFADSKADDA